MATIETAVEAKPRVGGDKNAARKLRRDGLIPAVLYGAGLDPVTVAVDPKQMRGILNSETGHNTIFDVSVNGKNAKAMIVDWQFEPIKGALLHVDLKRIAMDKMLRLMVPIDTVGEAPGVKTEGGILDQVLREVEVECLPADIPNVIEVDISELTFGKNIRVSDLPKNPKVKYLTDPNAMVVHVTSVKEEVVATPEAAAADAAAGPAEPEVIKKGKQDEEGAAPAAEKGGDKGGEKKGK